MTATTATTPPGGPDRDGDGDRPRRALEQDVERLTRALDHWREWKADYEALREDVEALGDDDHHQDDLGRVRRDFVGERVDDKELVAIFGPGDSRRPAQVAATLSHRLDYVERSIGTLERQFEAANDLLDAAATAAAAPPPPRDGDGDGDDSAAAAPGAGDHDDLPITEIMEMLDEDGNVISSTLSTPGGNSQTQLLEMLQKAGVDDVPEGGGPSSSKTARNGASSASSLKSKTPAPSQTQSAPPTAPSSSSTTETKKGQVPAEEEKGKSAETSTNEHKHKPKPAAGKKKSVAFSEETKQGARPEDEPSDTAKKVEELMRKAREEAEAPFEEPVRPADERADEAALREDMIRYNMRTMEYEMAPIVAELNLEEASDIDTDEYSDYDEDEDEDEDEDQWGRSTGRIVDDEWKRQMLELKERLSQHTFGADPEDDGGDDADEDEGDDGLNAGIGKITIKAEAPDAAGPSSSAPSPRPKSSLSGDTDSKAMSDSGKKSVRFAHELDIAEEKQSAAAAPTAAAKAKPEDVVDPLADVVLERTSAAIASKPEQQQQQLQQQATAPAPPSAASAKKPSRFKKAMAAGGGASAAAASGGFVPAAPERPSDQQQQFAPSGPEGQTLASSVLEHEPSSVRPREPDELDQDLLRQQVAEEYHRMRNRLVQRDGGFARESEDPVQPLGEEEGGPKRVSRFRAARLAKP